MKSLRSYLVFSIIIFSIFLQGCTTVISAAGDKRDLSTQYDDEKIGFTCTSDFSDIKGEFRASCNAYEGKVLVTGQGANQAIIASGSGLSHLSHRGHGHGTGHARLFEPHL